MARTTTNSSRVGGLKLSKRLSVLRSFHEGASAIWDIGCGHGLLGLSFLHSPEVSCIHLVDPSKDVIEKLERQNKASHIPKGLTIKLIHQKGQDLILGPERKTIFLAGMGGREMVLILENLLPQIGLSDRLIISPHRNVLLAREWLRSSRLGLFKEEVVLDGGEFYPVFCLIKGGLLPPIGVFGENIWKGKEGELYRLHQISAFSRHQDQKSRDYIAYLLSLN